MAFFGASNKLVFETFGKARRIYDTAEQRWRTDVQPSYTVRLPGNLKRPPKDWGQFTGSFTTSVTDSFREYVERQGGFVSFLGEPPMPQDTG
jgi:hypothetical protein